MPGTTPTAAYAKQRRRSGPNAPDTRFQQQGAAAAVPGPASKIRRNVADLLRDFVRGDGGWPCVDAEAGSTVEHGRADDGAVDEVCERAVRR